MLDLFQTALLVGLLYGLATVGAGLSFRVLDYPDLTLEGGGIFAAALSLKALEAGGHWAMALGVGLVGGCLAGALTATIHLQFGVSRLLSGIITSAALYSVNIRILGGTANRRLPSVVHTLFESWGRRDPEKTLALAGLVVILFAGLTILLFRLRLGYLLKAFGEEPRLVTYLGHSPPVLLIIGLICANGLVGISMALLTQYRRVVDVNMVGGLLVSTLAALVLGEATLRPKNLPRFILAMLIGTIVYSIALVGALHSWSEDWEKLISASDVRLLTGLLLLIATAVARRSDRGGGSLFSSKW